MKDRMFDHYVAVDWAMTNMAIARMTARSEKITLTNVPASAKELQIYLGALHGKKILALEEGTASQWLYTELNDHVDELVVCDPYRNHLLKEGPKTDSIDARKLVQLLRAGLLKPVFHSGDEFIYLRKLVSGYVDVVKACVRLKNQRAAIFRSNGLSVGMALSQPSERFVADGLEKSIAAVEEEKARYEVEFHRLCKKHKVLRNLRSIPGIGDIGAMKIASRVVDPRRFGSKGDFLSYCGLIRLERMSGGRSYGKKSSRYCSMLKDVFKFAALNAVTERTNHSFSRYYDYLVGEKRYPAHNARNAVARRIAVIAFGVLKSGKPFRPNPNWKEPEKPRSAKRS
jgi:transposase